MAEYILDEVMDWIKEGALKVKGRGPKAERKIFIDTIKLLMRKIETEGRGVRNDMPTRRGGYRQKVWIGERDAINPQHGLKVYLNTGDYPDGTLGEIFIDTAKQGSFERSVLSCFAIAVSVALQYGVPLEEFVEAFTFSKFQPSGMVDGHPSIKMCTSVIDFIFRELGATYLNRADLLHVEPPMSPTDTEIKAKDEAKDNDDG